MFISGWRSIQSPSDLVTFQLLIRYRVRDDRERERVERMEGDERDTLRQLV